MSDNFKQVVNLQPETSPKKSRQVKKKTTIKPTSKSVIKKKKSLASEIDQVYNNENTSQKIRKELSRIDKPVSVSKENNFFKQLSLVLLAVIAIMMMFYFLTNKKTEATKDKIVVSEKNGNWYSVQLTNEEVYYGFIKDISSDPVVLENVYYNYNQIQGNEKNKEEKSSNNIRLLKRGKEAHGPDGTMNIVRSQVMYMEALSDDSKILKAILNYEK